MTSTPVRRSSRWPMFLVEPPRSGRLDYLLAKVELAVLALLLAATIAAISSIVL